MKEKKKITRRGFIQKTSAGLGISILGASTFSLASEKSIKISERLPREVWIASLSLESLEAKTFEEMIKKVLKTMEEVVPYQPDIVCLPEIFPFIKVAKNPPLSECAEVAPGPITKRFAEYAKKYHCYVICPIYTKENGRFYNSAVVINRDGTVVGEYRKIRPTVSEMESGVSPGPPEPPVFKTDFGTIGIQICFDVNWHKGWRYLRKSGAEIVFWPSAFAGGKMLNTLAWINKYCITTSTRQDPTRIIDITGEELAITGRYGDWVCAPVNLEKAFIHCWPYIKYFDALRAKYAKKIRIKMFHDEGWAIIESISPDVKIADALKEFEIASHEEHIITAQNMREKYW